MMTIVVAVVVIGLAALAAQLLMNWSFVHVSIATGSVLGLLTPVFNVIFGIAIFGERKEALERYERKVLDSVTWST